MADSISVLSAGAVAPGLMPVLDGFRRAAGCAVAVSFATAPAIAARIAAGEAPDVVIAPESVLDRLAQSGTTAGDARATLGRIGVGLMVRAGAPLPKIATAEELRGSLLAAESIVYNRASTGIYLEQLFERWGIKAVLDPKITRYPDAAAVIAHVADGTGREIGFGATTVIVEAAGRGLSFVGPLPEEIQNYTRYDAAVLAASRQQARARDLVRHLASQKARTAFAAAGIH
ncbi:MAG TPA: substrate-binding domain-containing protein [candidate division Zixibacteria bacterium]|nr:substrate-binding domain-containing protein [candidate division Zixibacteria bacterium]